MLGLARSSFYYEPAVETPANLALMRLIDRQYTDCPFYGSRKMTTWLQGQGHAVNRKRVQRLMRLMGLEAIYPKPKLSVTDQNHKVFPYLLRDVPIQRVGQVWSTDITYVPLVCGFMYLASVIDWHSRYVIAWRLSEYPGWVVLPGLAGRGVGAGPAGGVQHRPGCAVHGRGLHPARLQAAGCR